MDLIKNAQHRAITNIRTNNKASPSLSPSVTLYYNRVKKVYIPLVV